MAKTPGRLLGTSLIRLYQLTLSGFIGNGCRHAPTCSEYGYEAVARFGLWKVDGWLCFALCDAGPAGTHGFDPVPETLESDLNAWTPWRFWRVAAKKDAGS